MNTGTLILVAGVGIAAFLYWKSQRDQAAALQAAAGAPGPGLLQKTENTFKKVFSANTFRATSTAVTAPVQSVASGAAGVVSSISHIF